MKVNNLFLLSILIVVFTTIWNKLFPPQQFLQSECIIGTVHLQQKWIKVVDCVICLNFPIQSHQKGTIDIRNGFPYMSGQQSQQQQYELKLVAYMQKDCIQYQCKDLQSQKYFLNPQINKQADLHKYVQIKRNTNLFWNVFFPYDNYISHNKQENKQISMVLFNNLFGSFIPYPMLISKQYYNGMAIKIRYSQPEASSNLIINKPITKISFTQQTKSDEIILSLIILFTLSIKLNILTSKINIKDILNLSISISFINPHFFSLISVVMFCKKNVFHVISLFVYFTSLFFDTPQVTLFSVVLSSFIQFLDQAKQINIQQLVFFNIILIGSFFSGIQVIVKMSPLLLWVICFKQKSQSSYSKLSQSQKQKIYVPRKRNEQNQILRIPL